MVYGRIVKCQISYLRRNRDARHLRNDVRTCIDGAGVVWTRWGSLRLAPIITSEMLDIVGRARARRSMGKKVDVQK